MKTIKSHGILWDAENLKDLSGNDLFMSYDEAVSYAKINGKRLPTETEMKELISDGVKWDDKNKIQIVGGVQFPAVGYKTICSLSTKHDGSCTAHWLDQSESGNSNYAIHSKDAGSFIINSDYHIKYIFMTVRLVQDIK